jgi:hypothetical protein
MHKIILPLFILLFTFSCKSKEEAAPKQEPIPADFINFLDKFSTDTVFQKESITFPLEGRPANVDPDVEIPADFKWQKENWLVHRQFSDKDGSYIRTFNVFKDIVSEETIDKSGQFKMERRFAKTSDGWKLIYYREMGL